MNSSSDAVDLLVDLRTMVITFLTGTSNGESDTRRMPRSDTSDLAQTFVRLARQLLGVPTARDTLETFALGDSNAIDHFILSEDTRDWNRLLQMLLHPFDLVFDGAAIQLDLHDVSLLLSLLDQANLETKIFQ